MLNDGAFLLQIAWMTLAATLGGALASRFGLPSLIGYLAGGLVLGPLTGAVHPDEATQELSHIGIVLLLYLVGLELSWNRVRRIGWVALAAGAGQIAVTFAVCFAIAIAIGVQGTSAGLMAAGLTLSSTIVTVKILDDRRATRSLYGQLALGILLMQDLAVVALLSSLGGGGHGGHGAHDAEVAQQAGLWSTLRPFLGLAILGVLAFFVSRTWLLKGFNRMTRSPDTLFIWGLAWLFAIVVAASWVGVSHEAGAFLAGFTLAQLPFNHDLRRRAVSLSDFFAALFFVLLGIGFTPPQSGIEPLKLGALVLTALALKPLIIWGVLRILRVPQRDAALTAGVLGHVSEFSFLLAAAALAAHAIDPAAADTLTLVGILTISIGSILAHGSERMLQKWRLLPESDASSTEDATAMTDHVIVVGMNTLGRRIVGELIERGETTLAIDTDVAKLRGLACATLSGSIDDTRLLEEADLSRAKLVISALHIDALNDLIAYRCQELGTPCAIHGVDKQNLDNLLAMRVDYILLPKLDGVKRLATLLNKLGYTGK